MKPSGFSSHIAPSAHRARVLLIYPPSRTQNHLSCPMGILMIAAVLEQAGHQVTLLDANAARNKRSAEQIIQHVHQLKPDIIGITLVTPLIRSAYALVSALRSTGAKLIAGGPHATLLPEEPLARGFDAVLPGEAEPAIGDAVNALLGLIPKQDVAGWLYRGANGDVHRTPPRPPVDDLDQLPFPARHLVNPADYGPPDASDLHGNIFSSRGCPARCAYCAGKLFGKKFRPRSAQGVLDEIRHVHQTYGTRCFHFVDDAMTINKTRARQILQGLIDDDLDITWSMMTRIDLVDEELLKLAARSGCIHVDYGIESGHPETLKRIHKPHTVEMVRHIVPLTASLGITPHVFFILGFPWDTPQTITMTRELMDELAPYVDNFHPAIASILIPFPGTEIYEKYEDKYALEQWWLSGDRNYDAPYAYRHSYFESKLFPFGTVLDADFFHYAPDVKQQIIDVFRFMYRHNLSNNRRLSRLARHIMLDLSLTLHRISPKLERLTFAPVTALEQFVGHLRTKRASRTKE